MDIQTNSDKSMVTLTQSVNRIFMENLYILIIQIASYDLY